MKEAYFLHMIESRATSPSSIPGSENFLEPSSYRDDPDAPTRAELEEEADATRHVPLMEDLDTPPASSGVRPIQHTEAGAEEKPPKTLRPGEYSHDRYFAHQAPIPEDLPPPKNYSLEWAKASRLEEWHAQYDAWENRKWLAEERKQAFNELPPPPPPGIELPTEEAASSDVEPTRLHDKENQNAA